MLTHFEDYSDPLKEDTSYIHLSYKVSIAQAEKTIGIPEIETVVNLLEKHPERMSNKNLDKSMLVEILFTSLKGEHPTPDCLDHEITMLIRSFYNYQKGIKYDLGDAVSRISPRIRRIIEDHPESSVDMVNDLVAMQFKESPILFDKSEDVYLILDGSTTGRCEQTDNFNIENAKYLLALSIVFYISKDRIYKPYFKMYDVYAKKYCYVPLPYAMRIEYEDNEKIRALGLEAAEYDDKALEAFIEDKFSLDIEHTDTFSWCNYWSNYFAPSSALYYYSFDIYLDAMTQTGLMPQKKVINKFVKERKVKQGKGFRMKKIYEDVEVNYLPVIPALRLRTMNARRSIRGSMPSV